LRCAGGLAAAAAAGIPRCEYEVLERKLQGLVNGGRKLFLTGHSIGAGLAAIFAQALDARCASARVLAARVGWALQVALMP
jgi:alpha-beta hydrolase superfamily lysophospholipase